MNPGQRRQGRLHERIIMRDINIIIISGCSGSGKSTALRTLEDLGFFCVDNLPVLLLPKFIDLCHSSSDDISRVALVMDVREGVFLKEYASTLQALRNDGYRAELIFLECSDGVIIQRFSETRRQHPLSEKGSVRDGLKLEREMLKNLKSQADRVLDTSELNVHQLRSIFEEYFVGFHNRNMAVTFMSFGYKFGVPNDVDIVQDVRFLPNPYFVQELKGLNGNDEKVSEYVFKWPETKEFLEKLIDFLSFQIPFFEREGKSYLTVACGCTGGCHRSVAIANYLKKYFSKKRDRVFLIHRDLETK